MIQIQTEKESKQEERKILVDMIRQFNHQFFPPAEWQPFVAFARDDSGRVVGGAIGELGHDWIYVRLLVVEEKLRGQGIGSRLIQILEQEGEYNNCIGVYLETMEFAAKDFYVYHGYTIFGVQENYPKGHTKYCMQKLLDTH